MTSEHVIIQLTNSEALVLFEWLAKNEEAVSVDHQSEQKVLWTLEGQLEKQVPVFAPNYKQLVDDARKQVLLS